MLACSTSSDHVWLKESSLNDQVVVKHSLHDSAENSLRDLSASLDIVRSISEDLWLDDWHETILLADSSVSSKSVGSLTDREITWHTISDLKDSSPFGKSAALVIESLGAASKSIKTLSSILISGSWENDETLVQLDTGMDSLASQQLHEVGTVGSSLVDGLLVHDHTGDVLLNSLSGKEELTVGTSVGLSVLNLDAVESLSNSSSGLVGGEDTLSSGADFTGSLNKLGLEGLHSSSSLNHFDLNA